MDAQITSLTLHNFQRYSHHVLKLDGITVLVGPSDIGKSSWIRAWAWLAYNLPRGANYVKHGEKEVYVTATYEDGTRITRLRDREFNGYKIDQKGKDVVTYDKIGLTVPEEVSEYMNVGPQNIQGQHDSVFFLGLSSSARGNLLNSLIDLRLIDSSLTKARQMVSKSKTAAAAAKLLENNLFIEIGRLPELTRGKALLAKAEKLSEEVSMLEVKHSVLAETLKAAKQIQSYLAELPDIDSLQSQLESIAAMRSDLQERSRARLSLSQLIKHVGTTTALLEQLPKTTGIAKALSTIQRALNEAKSLGKTTSSLAKNLKLFYQCTAGIKEIEAKLAEAARALPERCPTCNRLLTTKE